MSQSVKNNDLPTALIVGVAGFVGSHFAENLLAQNVKVVGIDSLVSGNDHYLEKLKKNKDFKYIEHDITQGMPENIGKIKYVIHVGAIEEYLSNFDITLDILKVNAQGTTHLLDYVKDNPGVKFMLGSSHNVYAGILSSLNLEHYFGISDRDSKRYAHHEAKRFAEALTAEYFRKYNIDARVVRVAHIYGPRMNLKAATDLSHLIKRAIYDDTLTIYGDGLKKIRPTFIYDVISGMSKALFFEQSNGKIYNLVSEQELTILEAAYSIQRNSTKSLTIQFLPKTEELTFPSHKIELLQTQRELGWKPKVSFDQGITETLEYLFLEQKKKRDQKPEEIQREEIKPKESKATVVLPHIEERIVKEEHKKTKKLTIQWSHVAQLVIVGISVFVILTVGILPIAAFYYYIERVTTSIASDNTQNQTYINSLLRADTQLNHVEWLYTIAQQREQLENTRELINTLVQIQDQQLETERHKSKVIQMYIQAVSNNLNFDEEIAVRDRLLLNIDELEYARNYISSLDKTLLTDYSVNVIKALSETLITQQEELKTTQQQYDNVLNFLRSSEQATAQMRIFLDGKQVAVGTISRDVTGIKFGNISQNDSLPSANQQTIYINEQTYESLKKSIAPNLAMYNNEVEYIEYWNILLDQLAAQPTSRMMQQFAQTIPDHIKDDNIALYNSTDRCDENVLNNEKLTSANTCLEIDTIQEEDQNLQDLQVVINTNANKVKATLSFIAQKDGQIKITLPTEVKITNFQQSIVRGLNEIDSDTTNGKSTYSFPFTLARTNNVQMVIEWEEIADPIIPIKTVTLPFGAKVKGISLNDTIKTYTSSGTRLFISESQ